MARKVTRDRVYYYVGGSEMGDWHACWTSRECPTIDSLLRAVRRQGYYAIRGSSKVGQPEGCPRGLRDWHDGALDRLRWHDDDPRWVA